MVGVWLIAGVVGALVIRKPGAALFVETVAAIVSALLGAQWGVITIVYGVVQGLAVELVFAAFLYRRWRLAVARDGRLRRRRRARRSSTSSTPTRRGRSAWKGDVAGRSPR